MTPSYSWDILLLIFILIPGRMSGQTCPVKKREHSTSCNYGKCSPCHPEHEPSAHVHGNVVILGAAGGIGQPLSLLMKLNRQVKRLALYDVAPTKGVAVDISHIPTPAIVHAYNGSGELEAALEGAHLVISVAGVTLKPGQTRDDLFDINAKILRELMTATVKVAPKAFVAIVSNPVNSLVPLAVEVFACYGHPGAARRIFGVTTLDLFRAESFAAEFLQIDPQEVFIPVIGAHEGISIIPVASQSRPPLFFPSHNEHEAFVHRVMFAGIQVLEAREGKGTATLSIAGAAARFIHSLLKAKNGDRVVECTYVKSDVTPAEYFSNLVTIGRHGVEVNHGLGHLLDYEKELVAEAIKKIQVDIEKGKDAGQVDAPRHLFEEK